MITITTNSHLDEDQSKAFAEIADDAFCELRKLDANDIAAMADKYQLTPWIYLFAQDGDRYVAQVTLDKRSLEHNGHSFTAVGVGGLAVSSKYQRQGIGTKLMHEAIAYCQREHIDLAFLNAGEALHDYYRRLGFELYEYKFTGKSGTEYLEDEGMVLFLNTETKETLDGEVFDIGLGNV